jgi:hypothetical protein
MNRRNFLGLAPIGVVAVASLVKGEDASTEVKKAKSITITGPDGQQYHPLVVEKNDEQYANVEPPEPIYNELGLTERARLTAGGYFI